MTVNRCFTLIGAHHTSRCRVMSRPLEGKGSMVTYTYVQCQNSSMSGGFEPSPRWGHCSASIGAHVYMYGGYTKDFSKRRNSSSKVYVFDSYLECWQEVKFKGPPPHLRLYYSSCACEGNSLYFYGGLDGLDYLGSFHKLDTRDLTWSEIATNTAGPIRKIGCGMLKHGHQLSLFGGYGVRSGSSQSGAEFVRNINDTNRRGWTNELHIFDLKEGTWSSPIVNGTRPPPCSNFSLTLTSEHQAVLFGGQQPQQGCINDVYIIDLTRMCWRKLNQEGGPSPVGRKDHAAVCLGYNGDRPQLLVTGGADDNNTVLNDAWMLDLKSGRWKEIKDTRFQRRCGHSATAINLCPGLTEVTLFGGCPEWVCKCKFDGDFPQIANTTVLRFERHGGPNEEWALIDLADSSQLGTRQRVREKMVKMSQAAHAMPVTASGEQRVESEWRTRRDKEAEECTQKVAERWPEQIKECKAAPGGARTRDSNSKRVATKRQSACLDGPKTRPKRSCKPRNSGEGSRKGECVGGDDTKQNEVDIKLDMKQQPRVFNYLKHLGTEKLLELGGELGLNPVELDKIPPEALARKLSMWWIQEQYNVKEASGVPTWRCLANALREVGENGVTDKLQETLHFTL